MTPRERAEETALEIRKRAVAQGISVILWPSEVMVDIIYHAILAASNDELERRREAEAARAEPSE